jgi:hypothetical protein
MAPQCRLLTQSGPALSDTAAFAVVARHFRGVALQAKSFCFVNIRAIGDTESGTYFLLN